MNAKRTFSPRFARAAVATAALALASGGLAVAQTAPAAQTGGLIATSVVEPPSREDLIAQAEAYLNAVTTLSGRFLQLGSQGDAAEGDFYLQRPGRVRFAYDDPIPVLIVADGRVVYQYDSDLETVDRVPIRQTPLRLLLSDTVDLTADAEITGVVQRDDVLMVTARDAEERVEGEMTLVFAYPALELRAWVIRDALGQETQVILRDTQIGRSIDPELFEFEDPTRQRRRGPR